ncbi:MAG TPA: glycogen synthase [Dehalococcoidales bacterium]|nr:glycogen synthase [Dehalococcoidales bacterium]
MNILFIASEAVPLAKVGGLADVAGALPKALIRLGHDVRLLVPQYNGIGERYALKNEIRGFMLHVLSRPEKVNLNLGRVGEVPVYTLENNSIFNTSEVYVNDLERFYFFSRAVSELLPHLKWQPQIIHCHDWMTALVPALIGKAGISYHSLLTIHNLYFQGYYDKHPVIQSELKARLAEDPSETADWPLRFMAQGIARAGRVNTVSPTYAREITTPEHGCGLDNLLRFRGDDLWGILNGIDFEVWDPLTDPYLETHYGPDSLDLKVGCKMELQKACRLPVNPDIPLIGMVQRLDEQKGLDILLPGLDKFLSHSPVQLVIQGIGREDYQQALRRVVERHPSRMAANLAYEEPLAHRIYAGCDLFLMPSLFEPCGLGQMIAMRYGAVPVVRHTGGLVDSVPEFNGDLSEGNGFVFHEYTGEALYRTLQKALDNYTGNRKRWRTAAERLSRLDFSWQASARRYEELYLSLQGLTY